MSDHMSGFRADPRMRQEAAAAIVAAFVDASYEYKPRPLDDVIDKALRTVAEDVLDRAGDQAICNKIDECHATSVVLHHLARWLYPGDRRRLSQGGRVTPDPTTRPAPLSPDTTPTTEEV